MDTQHRPRAPWSPAADGDEHCACLCLLFLLRCGKPTQHKISSSSTAVRPSSPGTCGRPHLPQLRLPRSVPASPPFCALFPRVRLLPGPRENGFRDARPVLWGRPPVLWFVVHSRVSQCPPATAQEETQPCGRGGAAARRAIPPVPPVPSPGEAARRFSGAGPSVARGPRFFPVSKG